MRIVAFKPIDVNNDVGDVIVDLTPEQRDLAEETLQRLARVAFKRRFSSKEYFEKFDRVHRGAIPRVRLSSVLMNLFMIPISPEAITALCVLYRKGDDVNYVRFCEDLHTKIDEIDAQIQSERKL